MSKIEINNVYKIFGNNPSSVLPQVKEGATKDEILENTGHKFCCNGKNRSCRIKWI